MENDPRNPVQELLHEIERGESASWFVYPPTPVWWPIGFGLWAAALTLTIGHLDGVAEALVEVALIAVTVLAMGWDRRRRGTYPTGRPPRELRPALRGLVLAGVVVAAVAWVVGAQVSIELAAVVAAVGTWATVAWYERAYAATAARVRERLG